ncbi:hypothetical protein B0919_22290 [Hymenobacter sp. CRA2]|nr:hypothetical protein B0919_22290 [Hymenobacter sp. CRA2]
MVAAAPAAAQTAINDLSPAANATSAGQALPVEVSFSRAMQASAVSALRVYSAQRGGCRTGHSGTTSVNGVHVNFAPSYNWRPGETVAATVTTAARSVNNQNLEKARVYQFTAAAGGSGRGFFLSPGSAATAELPVGAGARTIAAADVDNDGDLDLITGDAAADGRSGGALTIRLNDGRGVFSLGGVYTVGDEFTSLLNLVVGDVDADGDIDVAAYSYGPQARGMRICLNDGAGHFTATSAGAPSVGRFTFGLTMGDVDGDGDLDLASTTTDQGAIYVRFNNGDGTYAATGADVPVSNEPRSVALADVDSDGDLDIVASCARFGIVSVRLNNGSGSFSGGGDFIVGANANGLQLADLDQDGDLDLLTTNLNGTEASQLTVRFNNGTGSFSGGTQYYLGVDALSVKTADVDGDGDLDALAPNTTDNTVSVALNNGRGVFVMQPAISVTTNPQGLEVADLDGDNDLDLLSASGAAVSVRLNQAAAAPLPVALTRFTAERRGSTAYLEWTTAQEKTNAGFAVEASADGASFRRIGWVAGHGNSSVAHTYHFTDARLTRYGSNTVYYRLRQQDTDGTETTSAVQAVALPPGSRELAQLAVWPNPAREAVWVEGAAPGQAVQVLDAMGRVVFSSVMADSGPAQLRLPALPAGTYAVRCGRETRRLVVE